MKTIYDPSTNVSEFHTYNWFPNPQKTTGGSGNTFLDSRIREAVEHQLALRGYEKQTTGTPDFLVNWSIPDLVDTSKTRDTARGGV